MQTLDLLLLRQEDFFFSESRETQSTVGESKVVVTITYNGDP